VQVRASLQAREIRVADRGEDPPRSKRLADARQPRSAGCSALPALSVLSYGVGISDISTTLAKRFALSCRRALFAFRDDGVGATADGLFEIGMQWDQNLIITRTHMPKESPHATRAV